MIGIIAELTARPDQADALLEIMTDAAAQVTANEPGCLFYQVCRSRSDTNVFKLFEIYTDQTALDAHRTMPYFASIAERLGQVLGGAPKVELLDALAGSITAP